jgi:hypothetical protein
MQGQVGVSFDLAQTSAVSMFYIYRTADAKPMLQKVEILNFYGRREVYFAENVFFVFYSV